MRHFVEGFGEPRERSAREKRDKETEVMRSIDGESSNLSASWWGRNMTVVAK